MERYSIESYKDKKKEASNKRKNKSAGGLDDQARLILIIGCIAGVLAFSTIAFAYKTITLSHDNKSLKDQNKILQQQIEALRKVSTASEQNQAAASKPHGQATAAQKSSIQSSLNAKSFSGISPYLASSVQVVKAGSSTFSGLTPQQVIEQLAYLAGAAPPWVEVSGATLTNWQNGPYGSYFGAGTVVFQSSNNYVVSFDFTPDGQIDTVFMTNDAGVLTQTDSSTPAAPVVSQPNTGNSSE